MHMCQPAQGFGASPGAFGSGLFGTQPAQQATGGMFGSTASGLGQARAPPASSAA